MPKGDVEFHNLKRGTNLRNWFRYSVSTDLYFFLKKYFHKTFFLITVFPPYFPYLTSSKPSFSLWKTNSKQHTEKIIKSELKKTTRKTNKQAITKTNQQTKNNEKAYETQPHITLVKNTKYKFGNHNTHVKKVSKIKKCPIKTI